MLDAVRKVRDFLTTRGQAYRATFSGPEGEKVLADLARFCRAHESTFNENPDVARQLDGRREVFLRIQHQLQLTDGQLWDLYDKH